MRNLIAVIMALSAAAYACPVSGSTLPAKQAAANAEGSVKVQNDRQVPVAVYVEDALGGGIPRETLLGKVAPMQTASLAIPYWMLGRQHLMRIFLQPQGEGELESEKVAEVDGETLGVLVPASPAGKLEPAERALIAQVNRAPAQLTIPT